MYKVYYYARTPKEAPSGLEGLYIGASYSSLEEAEAKRDLLIADAGAHLIACRVEEVSE